MQARRGAQARQRAASRKGAAIKNMVAKDFVVSGRVQGVGYRYFAQEAAERRGIRGYARNLFNGDVEVHAEGDAAAIQLFKQDLQRGPRLANVTKVVESEVAVTGKYSSFLIRG
jgi:acylphosphatase